MKINLQLITGVFSICAALTLSGQSADSLKAEWKFNGNLLDNTGNTHDGTGSGNVTYGTDRFGTPNSVLEFQGQSGSFVDVQNVADFDNMATFTLSAWVYPTSFAVSNVIIAKTSPSRDFVLRLNNGKPDFHFHNGSYSFCTSANQLPLNTWSLITSVWDGSNMSIYVNCIQEKTTTPAAGMLWSGGTLRIGALITSEVFSGKIDDLQIWNRSLNPSEICELTSIQEPNGNSSENLAVYPNPFSTQGFLQVGNIKNGNIVIRNIFGQKQREIKVVSGQKITLQNDNLPDGVYFVSLIQDNRTIETRKFVVTH